MPGGLPSWLGGERDEVTERFAWPVLRPPTRLFEGNLGRDPVVNDRLDHAFAGWWATPGDRSWLLMTDWDGRTWALWWQLPRRRRPARIEVAGLAPAGLTMHLPWPVRRAGWWLIAGIPMAEAAAWAGAGIRDGGDAYRWGRVLGRDLQVRFPGVRLARHRRRRWVPTEAGLATVARLHSLGIRPDHFRFQRARRLSSLAGGDLERALDLVATWVEAVTAATPVAPGSVFDRLRVAESALFWLATGIDPADAAKWLDLVGPDGFGRAGAWIRYGFRLEGARLWMEPRPADRLPASFYEDWDKAAQARSLHLQLYGETNGLGPAGRPPLGWYAPRTWRERVEDLGEWFDSVTIRVETAPDRWRQARRAKASRAG